MVDEMFHGPEVNRAIQRARERGFMTYTELDALSGPNEYTSRQIEAVLEMLKDGGIDLIEDDVGRSER